MAIPTREQIQLACSAVTFERGEGYAREGRVSRLAMLADLLTGRVRGSDQSYDVEVRNDESGLWADCPCPAAETQDVCKHAVALVLAAHGRKAGAGRTDPVGSYLTSLTKEHLVKELLALAARDPRVYRGLEIAAAALTKTVDVRALKKQLTTDLRVNGMIWGRDVAAYAQDVDDAIELIEQVLRGGASAAAIELAEHAMARLDTAIGHIDDSGGWVGGSVDRLKRVHLDACRAERPAPRPLVKRMLAMMGSSDWEWFLEAPTRYADVLGDEGLDAFERHYAPLFAAIPPRRPRADHRFQRWAPREFEPAFLMEQIARARGDIDGLVRVLSHDLAQPRRYVLVASALAGAGRERESIAWLERGIAAFPPAGDQAIRDELVGHYLRDGAGDDAIELAQRGIAAVASFASYRLLQQAAGDAFPRLREAALARLSGAELVESLLHDDELEEALAAAKEQGCHQAQWSVLAARLTETRPDEALQIYRSQLEELLERADTARYNAVVKHLGTMRGCYAAQGDLAGFAAEVALLRQRFARPTALIARIDAAKWHR